MRLKYQCFTKDHNLEAARLAFENRYHVAPFEHKIENGILWVGPIPGQDDAPMFAVIEIPDLEEQPLQLVMF